MVEKERGWGRATSIRTDARIARDRNNMEFMGTGTIFYIMCASVLNSIEMCSTRSCAIDFCVCRIFDF